MTLEEDVFVGPGAMFTNIRHPRAAIVRSPDWARTIVERGATLGAGAILVAPVRVGHHAMVGAGAVVVEDVAAHAIVVGNPARVVGWACVCGETVSRERICPPVARCASCGETIESTDSLPQG